MRRFSILMVACLALFLSCSSGGFQLKPANKPVSLPATALVPTTTTIPPVIKPSVNATTASGYFSPDGDGVDDTLSIGISAGNRSAVISWTFRIYETALTESGAKGTERLFMEWKGDGAPPEVIYWNGMSSSGEMVQSGTDYPFRMVMVDASGRESVVSGMIAVDVLVLIEGDRIKILVPSIVFRANHADFIGLASAVTVRNDNVVQRIARILTKYPDYLIRIEGHANSIAKIQGLSAAKIQAEETGELLPLSLARAEAVRALLIKTGIDASRMTAKGLGSSEPVVAFSDAVNRWKNRRVEFVLVKR